MNRRASNFHQAIAIFCSFWIVLCSSWLGFANAAHADEIKCGDWRRSENLAVDVLASVGGGIAGTAASSAAIAGAGSVAGLSAAGLTSGLSAIGSIIGGGMAAGVAISAAPIVLLGGGAMVATHAVWSKTHP